MTCCSFVIAAILATIGLNTAVVGTQAMAASPSAPPAAPSVETEGLATPAVVSVHADEVWRTLERAHWVAERDASVRPNGKVLYVVTFRSCPTCAAFRGAEYDALLKAGVEVRWILYARQDRDGKPRSKPGERAMVAALWQGRDPKLMAAWWAAEDLDAFYAQPGLPPLAESAPALLGALAQSRALVTRLSGLFDDNKLDMAIPTLVWRQAGQVRAYIGYNQAGFGPARAFLTGP
jgi:hypothetical protein